MAFPFVAIGPSLTFLGWLRERQQSRRKVRLTVHRANEVVGVDPVTRQPRLGRENYYITVTNVSHERDIVVTHVWLETKPPVHIHDPTLPVRLRYSVPWETAVAVDDVPSPSEEVPWLARCQLAPDDKIVKSRPRENVPPFGAVPRG
jgi:hypothetical protein